MLTSAYLLANDSTLQPISWWLFSIITSLKENLCVTHMLTLLAYLRMKILTWQIFLVENYSWDSLVLNPLLQ